MDLKTLLKKNKLSGIEVEGYLASIDYLNASISQ
jgi:hypothetical protein